MPQVPPAGHPARRPGHRADRPAGAGAVRRRRPFKKFVSQLLALRLRRIVEADLAIRGGDLTAVGRLADEAARLRDELKGLSPVLDAEWVEDVYDELGWISLDSAPSDPGGRERLAGRLRSERYLTVLERLVGAVRAPKLADARAEPTAGDPQRAGRPVRWTGCGRPPTRSPSTRPRRSGTRPGGRSAGCSGCWTSRARCCRRTRRGSGVG